MRRLNIGCGDVQPQGWINTDVADHGSSLDGPLFWRPEHGPLDVGMESYDGAVAHHVLMMVPWPDLSPWLINVRRMLAPGAWLRVSVPDLEGAMAAYEYGYLPWFPISDAHETSLDGKLCMYLSQAGATRSLFTGPWLCELFERAGFHGATQNLPGETDSPTEWLVELDSRPDESIFVEGRA